MSIKLNLIVLSAIYNVYIYYHNDNMEYKKRLLRTYSYILKNNRKSKEKVLFLEKLNNKWSKLKYLINFDNKNQKR